MDKKKKDVRVVLARLKDVTERVIKYFGGEHKVDVDNEKVFVTYTSYLGIEKIEYERRTVKDKVATTVRGVVMKRNRKAKGNISITVLNGMDVDLIVEIEMEKEEEGSIWRILEGIGEQ